MATRSSTFSLRDAAIRTSTSSGLFGAGPRIWKSRLTSSSANGMYWLASASTVSSSSSSFWPAGTMIFLVITMAAGSAIATLRLRLPRRFHAALQGVADLVEVGDVAVGDRRPWAAARWRTARGGRCPCRSRDSSTSLSDGRAMSTPISDGDFVLKKSRTRNEVFRQAWRSSGAMLTIYIKLWQQV